MIGLRSSGSRPAQIVEVYNSWRIVALEVIELSNDKDEAAASVRVTCFQEKNSARLRKNVKHDRGGIRTHALSN